jgi:probable addiction module antidote protein
LPDEKIHRIHLARYGSGLVLGDIARARGMTQLAKDTGMGRESLYKALSGEGNPSFATILKVVDALGLQLHAAVRHV